MLNAIAYCRQSHSRDDQDDSLSLALQERRIRDYAARHDLEIVAVYSDLDVSGNVESRVGLNALLEHCARGTIQAVAIYNISRLARDTMLFLKICRELDRHKIKLVSASESMEDRTVTTVLSAFSERERVQLSNHVAYAVREQAQRGLVTQQPPIGYTRRDGILYPDHNAETVRRIFREYVSGQTTFQIASGLARDGIPSPYGKPTWRNKSIRAILSRRTYIGEIEISETRDPVGRVRPAIITAGKHEPLIDSATWEVAQRLLSERSWRRTQDGRDDPWLAGRLWCAHCGRRVYLGIKSRREPERVRWFAKCSTHQLASDNRTHATCPGQASCDLHLLEPAARRELWRALRDVRDAKAAYAAAVATISETTAQTRAALETQLARHESRSAVLLEARLNREIGSDEFLSKRADEDAAIARIEAELATVPTPVPLAALQRAEAAMRSASDVVLHADDATLRELVMAFSATAIVDLEAKTAVWRFEGPYGALV